MRLAQQALECFLAFLAVLDFLTKDALGVLLAGLFLAAQIAGELAAAAEQGSKQHQHGTNG